MWNVLCIHALMCRKNQITIFLLKVGRTDLRAGELHGSFQDHGGNLPGIEGAAGRGGDGVDGFELVGALLLGLIESRVLHGHTQLVAQTDQQTLHLRSHLKFSMGHQQYGSQEVAPGLEGNADEGEVTQFDSHLLALCLRALGEMHEHRFSQTLRLIRQGRVAERYLLEARC